jgi:hypothetical protein
MFSFLQIELKEKRRRNNEEKRKKGARQVTNMLLELLGNYCNVYYSW